MGWKGSYASRRSGMKAKHSNQIRAYFKLAIAVEDFSQGRRGAGVLSIYAPGAPKVPKKWAGKCVQLFSSPLDEQQSNHQREEITILLTFKSGPFLLLLRK